MTEISDPLDIDRPPSNRWAEVWRQFRAHKGAMAGACGLWINHCRGVSRAFYLSA